MVDEPLVQHRRLLRRSLIHVSSLKLFTVSILGLILISNLYRETKDINVSMLQNDNANIGDYSSLTSIGDEATLMWQQKSTSFPNSSQIDQDKEQTTESRTEADIADGQKISDSLSNISITEPKTDTTRSTLIPNNSWQYLSKNNSGDVNIQTSNVGSDHPWKSVYITSLFEEMHVKSRDGDSKGVQDNVTVLNEKYSQRNGSLTQATTPEATGSFPVADTIGRIIDGRLIVEANHTHMFWLQGQTRLCNLLRNMTNVSVLGGSDTESDSNTTTKPFSALQRRRRPLLNITMDCQAMKRDERFGEGNWITALYCVRIASALAKVDVQFQCSDGRESQMEMLLPWFDGVLLAPNNSQSWPYAGNGSVLPPTEEVACTDRYPFIRVDLMANVIRDDIRRMAIALVGSRNGVAQNQAYPMIDHGQAPLVPNVTLDDVVIHFRCGDVMGGARRGDFGMIQFSEYKRWINPSSTHRVGIVTQPFDSNMLRGKDRGKADACKRATYLLVDYLQGFLLPNTTISIHNNENETLPLAYARLAMAKQSFTSLSSFGIFPIIGTFGHGYFQQGNYGVNPFSKFIPDLLPNVHMMTAPVLSTGAMYNKIQNHSLDEVLDWFVAA